MVIQAVMYIFKSLGLKSLPFLPQIMPPFLAVMRSCKQEFREFLFQQLGMLVSIVKQHIREHLEQIFEVILPLFFLYLLFFVDFLTDDLSHYSQLIREYWNSPLIIQIIALVEEICLALNDEFKKHLPDFIPQMLNVLHTDRTPRRQPSSKILHALEVFGTNLDDYLHLVVPAVVKLFEQVDAPLPVRALAIQKLGKMAQKLNFSDYASRIIHPLARVLDEGKLVIFNLLSSPSSNKPLTW
jgi:FKBP12-rapamycin complex-associated protein